MADTDLILSQQLDGIIPTEISNEIVKQIMQGSICMKYAKVEPMTTPKKTIPVVINVPGATWVGEGEKIKVGKPSIVPVTLEAKKIAIIMTASREALTDPVANLFEDLKDAIAESFYSVIDRTILTGDAANPFKKTLLSVGTPNGITETDDIMIDISNTLGKVEESGFTPTVLIQAPKTKTKLRNLKTTMGTQLVTDVNNIYSTPVEYTTHFDNTKTPLITGDFDYLRLGVLQDIQYEVLRESTLTLEDGTSVNLGQDDLMGLRVTMRIASQVLRDEAFSIMIPKV
ncbi:hypothetical protein IO99_15055 [Clostridium sulfidigenes]|uniref:Phage capsid-like C-terminal domain-containing protein n=1 Tax=Clostridium sulfidigenes TaxID=318464 RepID=A0A084J8V6_9CLOT|nr:phage major capsid protein [Clostridium sulfidigenes]KEZ85390.1 hypothetical protein IO99_15055 [Clostridium sulfidigenes]